MQRSTAGSGRRTSPRPTGRRGTAPAAAGSSAGERRRRLSQNFFAAISDAAAFAQQLTIARTDLVVELGAGSGQVTEALVSAGHPVLALEIDPYWAERVERRRLPGVELLVTDIMSWRPERGPVAMIGNLPFGIGTQILRHVLELGPRMMQEGVFLLQHEYVGKRVGRWGGNLFNAQWQPWFTFEEGLAFRRDAFRPVPRADASTLILRPRPVPPVSWRDRTDYQSLAASVFNTGRVTLGEAARHSLGREAASAIARAKLDPQLLVKGLDVEAWAELFHAARAGAGRPVQQHRSRPKGRTSPSRRSRPRPPL